MLPTSPQTLPFGTLRHVPLAQPVSSSARKPPRSPRGSSPTARGHSARSTAASAAVGMPVNLTALPIYSLASAFPSHHNNNTINETQSEALISRKSTAAEHREGGSRRGSKGSKPSTPSNATILPDIRPPTSGGGAQEDVSWTSTPRPVPAPPSAVPPSQGFAPCPPVTSTMPSGGGRRDSSLPIATTLPRTMDRYLQQELRHVDPSDAGSVLAVHREVMRMFVGAFPSFSDVLSRVMAAYDNVVSLGGAGAGGIGSVRSLTLASLERGGAVSIVHSADVHDTCKADVADLKSQVDALQQRLLELQPELAAKQRRGTATVVSNKMLHAVAKHKLEGHIDVQQGKIDALEANQREDLERMLTLVRTAKASECRVRMLEGEARQQRAELAKMQGLQRAIRLLEGELRELKQTYSQTVPFISFQATRTVLERQLGEKEQEALMMRRLCARRSAELETVVAKCEALEARLALDPERPMTPRPVWEEVIPQDVQASVRDLLYPAAMADDGNTAGVIVRGHDSTSQVVSMLVERIRELELTVAAYQMYCPMGDVTMMDSTPASVSMGGGSSSVGGGLLGRSNSNLQAVRSVNLQSSVSSFVTRLGLATQPQHSHVLAFGVSPTIPPYLRAWGMVKRTHLSLTNTRQLILKLFDGMLRNAIDWQDPRTRVAFELHPFMGDLAKALPVLQAFGTAAVSSNVTANANARRGNPAGGAYSPSTGGLSGGGGKGLLGQPSFLGPSNLGPGQRNGTSFSLAPPSTVVPDVVAFGYSFYLAAQEYAPRCPLCAWYVRCLEGSMPTHIIYGAIDRFKAAREEVLKLAEVHGRVSIKRAALMESLGGVFTTKPIDELEELRLSLGDDVSIDVTQIVNMAHPFTATLIMQECNVGMTLHVALVHGYSMAAVPRSTIQRSASTALGAFAESGSEGEDEGSSPQRRSSPRARAGSMLSTAAFVGSDVLMIAVEDVRKVITTLEPSATEPMLLKAVKLPAGTVQRGPYMPLQTAVDNLHSLCLVRTTPADRDTFETVLEAVVPPSAAPTPVPPPTTAPRSRATSNAVSGHYGGGASGPPPSVARSYSSTGERSRGATPTTSPTASLSSMGLLGGTRRGGGAGTPSALQPPSSPLAGTTTASTTPLMQAVPMPSGGRTSSATSTASLQIPLGGAK